MKHPSLLNWLLKLSLSLNQKIIVIIWDMRLLTSAKSSKITSNVALFPYGSADCELQYKIIKKFLDRNTDKKFAIKYVKPVKSNLESKDSRSQKLLNYEEKLVYLCEVLGTRNFDVLRGAIDDYRRRCSLEELFEKSNLNQSLIHDIRFQIDTAKEMVDNNMILVMPDIAYTKSRSIKHFARKQDKKVLIINPYGEVRNISNYKPLDPDPSREELRLVQKQFGQDFDIQDAAHKYVKRRIKGDLVEDLDAQRAFNKAEVNTFLDFKDKKVLFLHCIADSANVPLESTLIEDIVLNDYFLWTRDMFEIISKEPSQWLIKIHPASKLYPKDSEIINRLVLKFKIPREIIIPQEISTLQVLISKAPIFTHSGTIALESAALGQRAVCIKGRFDDEVAFNVKSMKEVEQLAARDTNALQNVLKNNPEQISLAERWLFLWRVNFSRGKFISTKHPIQPNMDSRQYLMNSNRICIEFYGKILSRNFYSQLSDLLLPLFIDKNVKI